MFPCFAGVLPVLGGHGTQIHHLSFATKWPLYTPREHCVFKGHCSVFDAQNIQGEMIYAAPPPRSFRHKALLKGSLRGVVFFEAPRQDFYTTPLLLYASHPRRVFSGIGGGGRLQVECPQMWVWPQLLFGGCPRILPVVAGGPFPQALASRSCFPSGVGKGSQGAEGWREGPPSGTWARPTSRGAQGGVYKICPPPPPICLGIFLRGPSSGLAGNKSREGYETLA